MTIEETFKELDIILNKLEDKATPLEDAFVQYEKGIKLVKECNDSLDKVEKKILILQENSDKTESVDYNEF